MATWSPRLISTAEAAKLADLAGAKWDLETTIAFCDQLATVERTSPDEIVLMDALSTAIAVRYSRCFTTGVRARLDNTILAQLPDDLLAVHEYLRLVRDKYIAHSVNALEENRVTVHVREPPDAPAVGGIGTLQSRTSTLGPEDTAQVRALCEAVLAAVKGLLDSQNEIVKEQVANLAVDRVYDLPEPTAYKPDWENLHLPRRRN